MARSSIVSSSARVTDFSGAIRVGVIPFTIPEEISPATYETASSLTRSASEYKESADRSDSVTLRACDSAIMASCREIQVRSSGIVMRSDTHSLMYGSYQNASFSVLNVLKSRTLERIAAISPPEIRASGRKEVPSPCTTPYFVQRSIAVEAQCPCVS